MSEAESLLEFLYLLPVGVVQAEIPSGEISFMNPLATQVLMACNESPMFANVYEAFATLVPSLRELVTTSEGEGPLLESLQLDLTEATHGRDRRVMSLTAHRVNATTLALVLHDISKLVEKERELRLRDAHLRAIVDSVQAHMIVPVDAQGNVSEHNYSITRLAGFGPEVIGEPVSLFFQREYEVEALLQSTRKRGWIELSGYMNHASQQPWWGTSVLTRIINEESETIGYSLVTREDTARHKREEQLTLWSFKDPLTGLNNRRAFRKIVDRNLDDASRLQQPVSFLLLDIDHFKAINDTHGHDVGDEVLKQLAQRLRQCVREPDSLVRMGGEEFGVLLPNTDVEQSFLIAERARQLVAEVPFVVQSLSLDVTISLGVVSTSQSAALGFKAMYRSADAALYRAKAGGRNRSMFATTEELQESSQV